MKTYITTLLLIVTASIYAVTIQSKMFASFYQNPSLYSQVTNIHSTNVTITGEAEVTDLKNSISLLIQNGTKVLHLETLDVHKFADYYREIPGGCYNGLDSIFLPSIDKVPNLAFAGSSLKYIKFNDYPTTKASLEPTIMIDGAAFSGCLNLTTVEIPLKADISSGAVFEGCSNLTTVIIPNVVTIPISTFSNCPSLTTIDAPNADIQSQQVIEETLTPQVVTGIVTYNDVVNNNIVAIYNMNGQLVNTINHGEIYIVKTKVKTFKIIG